MKLSSPAFANGQIIPKIYALRGDNLSPPLAIEDVPSGSISLALIVHDPDAPVGDFNHWLVWNLPPDNLMITAGHLPPAAIEGKNDIGNNHWDGPAPPSGSHHYIFELYSLDNLLDLPLDASRLDMESAMTGHIIKSCRLIGIFSA